jgi:hypothetical protein
MVASIPLISLLLTSSCMQFWSVSVSPKYLNFATPSKDLLPAVTIEIYSRRTKYMKLICNVKTLFVSTLRFPYPKYEGGSIETRSLEYSEMLRCVVS